MVLPSIILINQVIVNWQHQINNHTALLHSGATLAPRLPLHSNRK